MGNGARPAMQSGHAGRTSMSLKPLTPQERSDALRKAAAARATRAAAKERLKTGELSIADVISSAETDDAIARMRIVELLEALPGIGRVRAAAIMEQLGIAQSRRVRGLGIHQRRALVDFIDDK
ncbi:integration host factor, actinobacterial type [Arthrobacter humicola]|uniref:Integration host factor, actinobacterial type n=2 Tax=Arthrobacter TaxID=1663 RepID=A0ABN2ZIA7_9MICC